MPRTQHAVVDGAEVTLSRLVAVDGRSLPLQGTTLRVAAGGGLARVVVQQRFVNPYAETLVVTYSLPLPHEAAVSGFAFTIGQRRVIGEIDARATARERYEQALLEGRTAALLQAERGSLFTQEIGNVPQGETVTCEITVDHRLAWLPDGSWEWRFPTVVAPRYLGAPGRVSDASVVSQDVALALAARLTLDLAIGEAVAAGGAVTSPSHVLEVRPDGPTTRVAIAPSHDAALDRDVVVRWPVAGLSARAAVEVARPEGSRGAGAYGLLTLVPPEPGAPVEVVPRDLMLLLDTSGSMSGSPIDQLQAIARAVVQSLSPRDTLEMIAFSTEPQPWPGGRAAVDDAVRASALAWIGGLQARGGTEMLAAVQEALRPARGEAQRQVVLLTDGEIGFESEVVGAIRDRLPRGSRLHVVGIGPAVNRSLTAPSARAGRGVELVVSPDDDLATVIGRLRARLVEPIVTELEISGSALLEAAPRACPDLYAGAPVLVSVRLRPEGGTIEVCGRTPSGSWSQRLVVPACELGAGRMALPVLYAREVVEDLEVDHAAGARVDARIQEIGLTHGIATRMTSWVAVSEEPSVDPGAPVRRVRQPQALPEGLSAEGLGLRGAHLMSSSAMLRAGVAQGRARAPLARCRGLEDESRAALGLPELAPPSPPTLRARHLVLHADGTLEVEIEVVSGRFDAGEIGDRLVLVVDAAQVPCDVVGVDGPTRRWLVGHARFRMRFRWTGALPPDQPRRIILSWRGQPLVVPVEP